MPRLVRRAPLMQRIKAYLDPWDLLLWLSEGLNSNDWQAFEEDWSTSIGIAINLAFVIAKAHSGLGSQSISDVFNDDNRSRGSGWLRWFVCSILVLLTISNGLHSTT